MLYSDFNMISAFCAANFRITDRHRENAMIHGLYQLHNRNWLLNFSTRSNPAGCFTNGGNKTLPGECLPLVVGHSMIALNVESPSSPEHTRARYTYAHAILIRHTDGNRPEINRNYNGPVTRYEIHSGRYNGLTSCWTGIRWCHFRNS